LERRLMTIFPNSNVMLTPIGNQVVVEGECHDAEEATQILQIVRAEVIRSLGRINNDNDDAFGLLGNNFGGNGNGFNQNGGAGNQAFRDIVVNKLVIPGEFNVKMRVVIAEINRSQLRNAGIDWTTIFNDARHTIGGSLGGATATTLSGIFENGQINILISWLASNGSITLLAEPQIVTMSGHPASILAGGEFAVPTTIGLTGGQTTTFRGFGTSLIVTPTIIDRDLIRLQLTPEFSSIDNTNTVNNIPGLNTKRLNTTVQLREGQTFALGGLISRQTLTEVSRIPLLGDIPFIGSRIFHSKRASEVETELLVLVSPEVVRPMDPDQVPPLPNDYITHPNDYDLFKYGRTEGNPDQSVYQIAPYGSGATYGIPQGYSLFNPEVNHGGYGPSQPVSGGYPISPAPDQGFQQPAGSAPPQMVPGQPVPAVPYPAQGSTTQQSGTSRFASWGRRK
ncbi:MAG: type II and III secretion system protein, partial [Planctomycetaceae bacterium]|nr:type II and III secretion system protein [Planctomycetaceae bacterium]